MQQLLEHIAQLEKLYDTKEVEISLKSAQERLEKLTNELQIKSRDNESLEYLYDQNKKDLTAFKHKVKRWEEIKGKLKHKEHDIKVEEHKLNQMFSDLYKTISNEKAYKGVAIIDKTRNQAMKVDIQSNLSEMENKFIFTKIEEFDKKQRNEILQLSKK